MASGITWQPIDSDDELEDSNEFRDAGRTANLFIIDSSSAMFQTWGENSDTPFRAALKCCQSIWRSKIISNPKDFVAILLSGTEKQKNDSGFPNLYVLQEMAEVKVRMIERLNAMTTSEDLDGFEDRIGSGSDYNLKEVFWLAKILYDEAKAKALGKKLMYFTCEDNPHSGQTALREDAIKKFKDLKNLDFSIVTFREDFDYKKFYDNLIEDQSSLTFPKDLGSLTKIVRVKQRVKRTTCRSQMEIVPGLRIGVGLYSLVRRTNPPKPVKINKRNDEPLTRDVRTFRKESGMTVLKSEELRVTELKGEMAVFTPGELKMVNLHNETGIKIIGFINADDFDQFTWFRCDGYFVYPDEERVTGSSDVFTTLLRRCHVLKKIALAKITLSRGRSAKLGCLIPSVGESTGDGAADPTGFYCFIVPFQDELRAVSGEESQEAPPELVELFESIIKKTTNKSFDLQAVQSPSLQSLWRQIEIKAFDQDGEAGEGGVLENDEEFFDFTEPNEEGMQNRIGLICTNINERVGQVAKTFHGNYSTVPAKKPRTVNMAMEAKNKRVEKLTCEILKGFLDPLGITTERKRKADLVQDVYNYFGGPD